GPAPPSPAGRAFGRAWVMATVTAGPPITTAAGPPVASWGVGGGPPTLGDGGAPSPVYAPMTGSVCWSMTPPLEPAKTAGASVVPSGLRMERSPPTAPAAVVRLTC